MFFLSTQPDMPNKFKNAGFAGYIYYTVNPKTYKPALALFNYALGTTTLISHSKKDFLHYLSLEENIKKTGGLVMLDNSYLKQKLDGERTGLSISQIVELLSSLKILKIFPETINPEFALRAARNFDIKDMPEINDKKIDEITELLKKNNFKAIFEETETPPAIKLSQSHPISVYIKKLNAQENETESYNEFVKGIIEKILAAGVLRKKRKANGLQDKTYEIILGRALLLQAQNKTAGFGVSKKVSEIEGKNMLEAEEKLYETLQPLILYAFLTDKEIADKKLVDKELTDKRAQAINSIIELIPAIAEERRRNLTKDDIKPNININNYKSILAAA